MLLKWLKSYKLNRKALSDDMRTAGKALLALAFAVGVYPGSEDPSKVPLALWGFVGVGFLLYVYGLKKTED